jgi:hypothetical protein
MGNGIMMNRTAVRPGQGRAAYRWSLLVVALIAAAFLATACGPSSGSGGGSSPTPSSQPGY